MPYIVWEFLTLYDHLPLEETCGLQIPKSIDIIEIIMKTKRTLKFLFVLGCMMIMVGCRSSYFLVPDDSVPSDQVRLDYLDGKPLISSLNERSEISAYVQKTDKNEIMFYLWVKNTSNQRLDFLPENITVIGENQNLEKMPLTVYTHKQYIKKRKRAQFWSAFADNLSDASDVLSENDIDSAGLSTTYSENSTGQAVASVTYDYGKVAELKAQKKQARREAEAAREQRDKENKKQNSDLKDQLLKRNTIAPNKEVEGSVFVKFNGAYDKKFYVTIPVGDDVYEFTFIPELLE